MGWRDRLGALPRWARLVLPGGVVLTVILVATLVSRDDGGTTVTAADVSTTTSESTTSTTVSTTTTTEAPTTTVAPTTTMPPTTAPPTTAPPTTAPPPTAPPTTAPAAPTEFRATVRGRDQGPDYYGIFYGRTFGGDGGFRVTARCRPGTVTVTVLEDGWDGPPDNNSAYPTHTWVYVDDSNHLAYDQAVTDGSVISGPVTAKVHIHMSGPSEQDMRIQYDCRG